MPSPKKEVKKRRKKPSKEGRLVLHFLKLFLSPVFILWDSFRYKGRLDNTWLFSFMILITFLLGVVLVGFFITEGPVERTLTVLTNVNANQQELAGDIQPVIRYVNQYALRYGIDPNLILAIIKTESNFNPKAISRTGARGLMQVMPAVWRKYSRSTCSGLHNAGEVCSKDCIYEPEANIRVGVKYFSILLRKYRGRVDLALEAYNAGMNNILPGSKPNFGETKGYLQKTLAYWQNLRHDMLAVRLQASLNYQKSLKWLLTIIFGLWLIFFGWANRKIF